MLFFRKIGSALSALNAVTDVIRAADMQNINELTFYVVGSSGVVSGAVTAEEAHDDEYTGNWAPNGAAKTVVADTCGTVKVTGVAHCARMRVSTVLAGGTVDIWALGRK